MNSVARRHTKDLEWMEPVHKYYKQLETGWVIKYPSRFYGWVTSVMFQVNSHASMLLQKIMKPVVIAMKVFSSS